jgi:hypothetical protein
MLNLLPKIQKKAIIREYRIRFIIMALVLLLMGEAIALVLMAPPYITASLRIGLLNSQSAGLKVQTATAEANRLSDIVKQTNTYLAVLTASSTPTGAALLLEHIIAVKDANIRLTSFNYSGKGQQKLDIGGTASTRQALLDFVKKLKSLPGIVVSDLPVSDFAKSQDIDFSVNVTVADPKK